MKLLADENVAGDVVSLLRQQGHDVAWIRQDSPGSADEDVLARSAREQRLLVTFDKDFGELVWRAGQDASAGVILFRISMSSSSEVASRVAAILDSRDDWSGQFSVVDDRRIRMIALPFRNRTL